MRKKILFLTLTLSAVMLAAGCGKPKTVKEDIVAESEEKDTVDITTDPTNSPTPTIKTEDDFTEEDFKNAEYVAIDNVNVRANPDANSDIISSMEKGSRVKVSGREEDKEGNNCIKYLLMIQARFDICQRNMLTLSIRKEIQRNEKR